MDNIRSAKVFVRRHTLFVVSYIYQGCGSGYFVNSFHTYRFRFQ